MKLSELQKKVAELLGVSSSQKELSFEIFIDNVYEALLEGITLKVGRLGYFQKRISSSSNEINPLIFCPIISDPKYAAENLYLTIDVIPKMKATMEFDSHVFSIGVGKPLLPLTIDDMPDAETSYVMLKKSIEERVKELIAESDQIPNFNIWDDYYKSPDEFIDDHSQDVKSQLFELTSDLVFSEPVGPQSIPQSLFEDNIPKINLEEEKIIDQIKLSDTFEDPNDYSVEVGNDVNCDKEEKMIIEDSSVTDTEETDIDYLKLDNINTPLGSLTIADLLEDNIFKVDSHVIENVSELESNIEAVVPEIISDKVEVELPNLNPPIEEEIVSKLQEEVISEYEEEIIPEAVDELKNETTPSVDDEIIAKAIDEINIEEIEDGGHIKIEKENLFEPQEILRSIIEETDEDNLFKTYDDGDEETDFDNYRIPKLEKIEWNWGDELKEEFGIGPEEDEKDNDLMSNYVESDESLNLIDEKVDSGKSFTKDLFHQLEKTLEREIESEKGRLNEAIHKEIPQIVDEKPFQYSNPDFDYPSEGKTFKFKKPDDEPSVDQKNVVLEFSGPPVKYEFVEDKKIEKRKSMAITLVQEERVSFYDPYEKPMPKTQILPKENRSNKTYIIVFSSLLVVVAAVVFFILKSNIVTEPQKQAEQSTNITANQIQDNQSGNVKTESPDQINSTQQKQTQEPSTDSKLQIDEFSDFPFGAKPPVPIKNEAASQDILGTKQNVSSKTIAKPESNLKTENNIYQNVPNDTRVSGSIYFDGKNYSYQTSSWRNKQKAEDEVKRLRALGFSTFIMEAYLPQKGGTWYRVRIGGFNSVKDVQDFVTKNNF